MCEVVFGSISRYLTLILRQRIIEVESEQPRVLSDYRGGNDVENVIVSFLGDLAADTATGGARNSCLSDFPASSLSAGSPCFRPSCRKPSPGARKPVPPYRRCIGCIWPRPGWISEKSWRSSSAIELRQFHQRAGVKSIGAGSGRNELPHSLGDSEPGGRSAGFCVEVALHQAKVEELGRHAVIVHGFGDRSDVAVFFGQLHGPDEPGASISIFRCISGLP